MLCLICLIVEIFVEASEGTVEIFSLRNHKDILVISLHMNIWNKKKYLLICFSKADYTILLPVVYATTIATGSKQNKQTKKYWLLHPRH